MRRAPAIVEKGKTMHNRRVEKMSDSGQWVQTAFEQVYKGEVIRFFEGNDTKPLQQNGASVFLVVDAPHEVGREGNCSVAVVPMGSEHMNRLPLMTECHYWSNIVVKQFR